MTYHSHRNHENYHRNEESTPETLEFPAVDNQYYSPADNYDSFDDQYEDYGDDAAEYIDSADLVEQAQRFSRIGKITAIVSFFGLFFGPFPDFFMVLVIITGVLSWHYGKKMSRRFQQEAYDDYDILDQYAEEQW